MLAYSQRGQGGSAAPAGLGAYGLSDFVADLLSIAEDWAGASGRVHLLRARQRPREPSYPGSSPPVQTSGDFQDGLAPPKAKRGLPKDEQLNLLRRSEAGLKLN